VLVVLVVGGWLFYFLLFHSYFDIKKVTVVDPGGARNRQVENIVKQVLTERVFFVFKRGNMHLASKGEMEKRIRAIVSLENIKIRKQWPATLYIVAQRRVPELLMMKVPANYSEIKDIALGLEGEDLLGLLESPLSELSDESDEEEDEGLPLADTEGKSDSLPGNDSAIRKTEKSHEYFYVDTLGITIERKVDVRVDELSEYPLVVWQTDKEVGVGKKALDEDVVAKILELEKRLLPEVNAPAERFLLSDALIKEIHVETKEGWRILLDSNADISKQLQYLSLILQEKVKEGRADLEYVDLRIDGRVYYK